MTGSVRTVAFWFSVAMMLLVFIIAPSVFMRIAMTSYIFTDVSKTPQASAALVLGASVIRGEPSPILAARTEAAKQLYDSGKVPLLILSGAVEPNYDEVTAMKQYLLSAGIPEDVIALDESGFDTFSSVYRARNVLLADTIIMVTQDFHVPRAVFIARALNIKAYGLSVARGGKLYDYLREIPASWKALWDVVSRRLPINSENVRARPSITYSLLMAATYGPDHTFFKLLMDGA